MNGLYEELRVVLHGIWNRRWLALAVAWGVCLIGWLAVALIPNSYESRSRILIDQSAILSSQINGVPVDRQRQMDQLRQTLTAQANLEKVVRGTELGRGLDDGAIAAQAAALREHVSVIALQDNLFEISVLWSDSSLSDAANARLAGAINARLIDAFVENNLASNRTETAQAVKILDQQIAQRGAELQKAEQRLAEFESKYASVLPGTGSLADRMAAGRAEISQIDSQLVAAQSALSAINSQMAGTPVTLPGGAAGGGGLAQAQADLAGMRARGWTDAHPDVVATKNRIANLRAMGDSGAAIGGMPNPAYQSMRSMQADRAATVNALQARKAQLQGEINRLIAAQASDPAVAGEQGEIARAYQVLKDQYDKLVADREQIKLRGDVQAEGGGLSFRVINPPSTPRVPAFPNRPLLLIGVLIVGIGAGVATAFAIGQLKTTYATAERLERASGLPVLGAITETVSDARRAVEAQRRRWFLGASGALVGMSFLLIAVEFIQRGMIA